MIGRSLLMAVIYENLRWCCILCSGLWPGRGDGRGIGDPGQFVATPGDRADVNGLSVCDCMYPKFGPGECAAIGLGCGFNGLDGIIPPLGEGWGIWGPGGDVILKFGWFWPMGWGLAGVCGFEPDGGVIGCWNLSPPSRGLCGARRFPVLQGQN